MSLQPGTKLGPYEILSQLGAGGMGEVYKARDTRLDRFVAIKVLPEHLADNPELRERFEREARTIAKLNHPHICTLHDIGQQDGTDYLVMEYLEGETLAQRLKKGPLPLAEVLHYAVEVSDALDKAHRAGVTHRDIKPGNIIVTKEGTKLLDFGLAKLKQEVFRSTTPASQMPTVPGALTEHGTLLGTLHYMAPEQVEGKVNEIDARTDIFAFGALVYEMATGKRAFPGETQASVIAKILEVDPPPMSTLQPMTPPALDRMVKTCLAKDPDERWQTARDVTRQLKWITEGGSHVGPSTEAKLPSRAWRRAVPVSLAAMVVLAVGMALGVWMLRTAPSPQVPAHVTISLAPGDLLTGSYLSVAVSPDGSRLVYVAAREGVEQLFLRTMDSREAKPLPGTEGAATPFFSPDGQWIGFFAGGKLKKASISGGAPVTLTDSGDNRGAAWGPDDTIVFAPSTSSGLLQVSAAGGTPQVLTTLDASSGEISHRYPQFLPESRTVLFTVETGTGWDETHIAILKLDTGERRIVLRGGNTGRFVPSGHLVYFRAGSLLAAPFDPVLLEVTSTAPVMIAEGIRQFQSTRGAQYAFSNTGTLAYVPASLRQFESRLVWVDRTGKVEALPAPIRNYYGAAVLSPDGQRVAVTVSAGTDEIWIYDLAGGSFSRLPSEAGGSRQVLWMPDGKHITYQGIRGGYRNLFWRAADGTGPEERLTTGEEAEFPTAWSPDGKVLAFWRASLTTAQDIWLVSLEGDQKPRPFLQSSFGENWASFSPDGRWLAYLSDESGRYEIYVRPFPGPGGKWQVSTDGGIGTPRWAASGRELFYPNGNKWMAVDVQTQPTFRPGRPRVLFEGSYEVGAVTADGQRFLAVQPVEPEQPATQINVVLNWFEELKRRVPAAQ